MIMKDLAMRNELPDAKFLISDLNDLISTNGAVTTGKFKRHSLDLPI